MLDVPRSNAYVARVNLLLLLSALLSALTGAVTGGRVSEVPRAVCCAKQASAVQVAPVRTVAARPTQEPASLGDVAHVALPAVVAIAAIVPAYASRRRE